MLPNLQLLVVLFFGAPAFVLLVLLVIALTIMKLRGLPKKGGLLYLATLVLELPGVIVRFFIGLLAAPILLAPVWFLLALIGFVILIVGLILDKTTSPFLMTAGIGGIAILIMVNLIIGTAALIAFGPIIWSILNLVGMKGGHRFTPWSMGARTPSTREREAYTNALVHIQANAPTTITAPSDWFVIDTLEPEAYTIGTTLYLSREVLRTKGGNQRHLIALIAHELGHINTIDGRLSLALRRLVLPPVYLLSYVLQQVAPGIVSFAASLAGSGSYAASVVTWFTNAALAISGGGAGLFILSPFWAEYWRSRDYAADTFAAEVGVGQELIDFLELYEFKDVAVPYYMMLHPYIELRIDRLLSYQQGVQSLAYGQLNPQPQP